MADIFLFEKIFFVYIQKALVIWVHPALLLGFKIPSFIIPQYLAEVYSVHFTNPNTHKLLTYHVSSNTLLP